MNRLRAPRVTALRTDDDGVAVVEMAVVLGLLLLLAVGALPVFSLLVAHTNLGKSTAEGIRFATKVERNPCVAGTADCVFDQSATGCLSDARRRPSAAEVTAYLVAATGNAALDVQVHPPDDPSATLQPCNSDPGDPVAVTAAYDHDLGIFAAAANAASALTGGGPMFTNNQVRVTSTAVGVQE